MLEVKNINEVNIKNLSLDNVQLTIRENIFVTLTKLNDKTIATVINGVNVILTNVISEDIDEFIDYLIDVNVLSNRNGNELIPNVTKIKLFGLLNSLAEFNVLYINDDVEEKMLKQEIDRIEKQNEYFNRVVKLNELDINDLKHRLSRL